MGEGNSNADLPRMKYPLVRKAAFKDPFSSLPLFPTFRIRRAVPRQCVRRPHGNLSILIKGAPFLHDPKPERDGWMDGWMDGARGE